MLHKALEGAIILETFPKTTVDVFALVLESGGGQYLLHMLCCLCGCFLINNILVFLPPLAFYVFNINFHMLCY